MLVLDVEVLKLLEVEDELKLLVLDDEVDEVVEEVEE